MNRILKILADNARLSDKQIAAMAGVSEAEAKRAIAEFEQQGIIKGYKAIFSHEKAGDDVVTALIELKVTPKRDTGFDEVAETVMAFDEVESVYLMSGVYDLAVLINGKTFQEIAMFVARRLSTIDGVVSTSTHFILRRYKDNGLVLVDHDQDERRNTLL